MWLTVDPGLRGCGFAYWRGASLMVAGFAPGAASGTGPPVWAAAARAVVSRAPSDEAVTLVVVETMKVYTHGSADPADLLELQGIAGTIGGMIVARGGESEGLDARTWKGQVPREITGNRVAKKILDREWWPFVQVPPRKTHLNDAMHAVGIGLYVLSLGRVPR